MSGGRQRSPSLLEAWAIVIVGGGAASVLASYLLGYLAFTQAPQPLRFHLLAPPLQAVVYPALADPKVDTQVTLYASGATKDDSLWISQSDDTGLGAGHSATVTDVSGNYAESIPLKRSDGVLLSGAQKFEVTDKGTGSRGVAWLTLPRIAPPAGPVSIVDGEDFGLRLPSFSWISRPHFVTLDSIDGDPDYGDQRAFLRVVSVKNFDPDYRTWRQTYRVHDGEAIAFEMLVFNGSAPYLHLSTKGARARLRIPQTVRRTVAVRGEVTAANAVPRVRWDTVKLVASHRFRVIPLSRTTKLWSKANWRRYRRGSLLQEGNVYSPTGIAVGDRGADGVVAPAVRYWSTWVTVRARIEFQP